MPAPFPTLAHLKRVTAIFCFALASAAAAAEGYPERPVTFVVPYTAGSQTDQVARLLAQALQERLGQPFLVENKAGSSGLLAALTVARAAPDGYTLMVTTNTTHAAAPGLFKNVPYDPVKDFTPIAQIGIFRSVIAANMNLPVRSMSELVSYARANPGKLEYGQGNGTTQVVFETMKKRVGNRYCPRSLSQQSRGHHRPRRRPYRGGGAGLSQRPAANQSRPHPPARGDDQGAQPHPAGRAHAR